MDPKKPAQNTRTNITEEIPPLAPDREHMLAKTFEDANLNEVLNPPAPQGITSEAADAIQELVVDAAGGGDNIGAIDITFTAEENPLDLQLGGGEAAPKPTITTGQIVIQKGADSQSFACEKHEDLHEPTLMPHADSHEMPIVKELCATTEANLTGADGADLFLVDSHTADNAQLVARCDISERMMQLVVCEMNFDDLVEAVLTVLVHGLHAQAGSILERDNEKEEFFFRASVGGGDPEQLKAFRVPANKGIVGHVAESKQTILLRDVDDSGMQLRAISMSVGFEAKSCLAAPILIANQLYGVVELFNKQGSVYFDEKDVQLLEAGLALAAKVLEVRFLMAELHRRAG